MESLYFFIFFYFLVGIKRKHVYESEMWQMKLCLANYSSCMQYHHTYILILERKEDWLISIVAMSA